jgi:hypothetical protein
MEESLEGGAVVVNVAVVGLAAEGRSVAFRARRRRW